MQSTENVLDDSAGSSEFFDLDEKKYKFRVAIADYSQACQKWRLLLQLAYAEIGRRYRRTLIGPFWAVLSLAIFITSMGTLFSLLWNTEISTFLPFFASGFVVWIFFSTIISDSCTTFIASEHYLKQVPFPYSFYAFLLITRNLMLFFHQLLVYLVVAVIFHIPWTLNTWLIIPGLLLLVLNASWIAILLGLFCLRFRDIQQVVTSLLQITMFVTPIFWSEAQLTHKKAAFLCVNLNPMYHFLSVVRYPLLGQAPTLITWVANIAMLIVGWFFTMYCLTRVYNKLVYWL